MWSGRYDRGASLQDFDDASSNWSQFFEKVGQSVMGDSIGEEEVEVVGLEKKDNPAPWIAINVPLKALLERIYGERDFNSNNEVLGNKHSGGAHDSHKKDIFFPCE